MRKVLLWLVLALMVSVAAVNTFAAGAPTVEIAASDSVAADGTVVVTVRVNNGSSVKGIAVVPDYDASVFQLVSGTWLVSGVIMDFSVENGDGVLAFADATDIHEAIFSYTLKVKSTASAGTQNVGCTVVLRDANNQNTTLSGSTGIKIRCSHSFAEKNTDERYLKSKATCTVPAQYYYSCIHCGEKGSETFEGPAPTHRFETVWRADVTAHWHACQNCDAVADWQSHVPGEDASQQCQVCGCVLTPAGEHVHDFTFQQLSNAQMHWGKCACGAVGAEQVHAWDAGTVITEATAEQTGVCLYTCQACGYQKSQMLEKLYNGDAHNGDHNRFMIGLLTGVVLTALLGGGAIWIAVRRKRKKD